jgi:hypothetical protein
VAQVLISDLDGVIRHWDPGVARAAEERIGLPAGCIEREAFAPDALTAAITGSITDEAQRHDTVVEGPRATRVGKGVRPRLQQLGVGRHVSAAAALGLDAHHFRSVSLLAEFLATT